MSECRMAARAVRGALAEQRRERRPQGMNVEKMGRKWCQFILLGSCTAGRKQKMN
jgi:hypothetical protein